MQGGRARRVFLYWARPTAPVAAAAAYGIYYAARPSAEIRNELLLLGASVLAAFVYIAVCRAMGAELALSIACPVDTLLIAAMTLAVGRPELLAIAYFWSIGVAAFLLGPRATLLNAALAAACAAGVPYLSSAHVNELAHVTDVIVLLLFGGLLAVMAQQAERAERELETERDYESAALRIAERIHSSLELAALLGAAVEELRTATGAARAVLRLARRPEGWLPLVESVRPGLSPLAFAETPSPIARLWTAEEPIVIHDSDDADPELAAYLRSIETRALIGFPVRWQGRTLAIIGIHDDAPRAWARRGLALLERVVPQLAAAIAQAELFEQQQAALGRLEELTRLREELVANVSHELRTPLTSTIGFLQTLERSDLQLDADERGRLLTIARKEAERLSRLVEELLQLTRFEHGQIRLRSAPVRLRALTERALAQVAPEAGRAVALDVDDVTVAGDEDRLLQVLTNLLENAFRHGAGTVRVTARANGGGASVTVADEGPGVPAEAEGSLFEPFARWSRSEGTGLGLAISRRIVEAHGGTLQYRPAGAGSAHAFVVELPAEPDVSASAAFPRRPPGLR